VKVAFSLAFATAPKADAGFFVCQQHYPENFWNPAFQDHPNTTIAVGGVMLVAQSPEEYRGFLSAYANAAAEQTAGGIAAQTARGLIEIVRPDAFAECLGLVSPDISAGARIAALRLSAGDATSLGRHLTSAGISHVRRDNRVIVDAMGATIVFETD
jgi:hypothetical protein